MTTKRKNGSKRKGWSDVYTSRDVSLDTDYISEDSNTESNIILPFKKVKYLWISELKEKHHLDNFKDDHLVMIPGYSTQLSDMTLSKFLLLNESLVQGRIGEVITIPRNLHGQIYIVAGLQSTPHFSLSTAGVKFLQDICNKRKVPFITLRNTDHSKKNFPERSTTETVLYAKSFAYNSASSFQRKFQQEMEKLANHVFPVFFQSDKQDHQRAMHLKNFGITDQRVDKLQRITITGRVGLALISMDTKERKVSVDSRKGIGNFILYIIKEVIPYTGYGSLFQTTDKYELEWIRKFAEQLLVTDEEDKKIFTIPAATFLINKDLNLHCNSMNRKRRDLDNTLGVHASIPISKIPECCKQQVRQHYPGKLYIPLCAVFYNRNALVNYSKRQRNVDEFISSSGNYKEGRNKIVGLLRCVNTDADYVGMLYSSSQRIKLSKNFKLNDFGTNMLTLKEAVDKIGWWSSLLHMSYLFFFKYGLRKKDIFSLILFFLHQCNTTVLIVCALEQLIVNKQNKKDFRNLYKELCFVCAKL